jgi:NarL family two-component system sensor histidine kinase YdfH
MFLKPSIAQATGDLRQPVSSDLGEAIQLETRRFTSATGIPCDIEIHLPVALPEAIVETAIRALAEGLSNIARHARARRVSLRVKNSQDGDGLEIALVDDGIGFDPNMVEAGHYGLLGMGERIRLAGGRLDIRSAVGAGTQLTIHFPLEGAPNE